MRKKIVAATRKHGIEMSEGDNVARPSGGLTPARTRRAPRDGRKVVRPKRPTTTAQRKAARRNVTEAVAARHHRRN